jgi:hypothetical protein
MSGGTTPEGERLIDCLQRFVALAKGILQRADGDEDDGEAAQQEARRLTNVDRELRAVMREWQQAGGADGIERDNIRLLAARAQELTQQLEARADDSLRQVRDGQDEMKATLGQLGQGHSLLRKYRGGESGPGYVDRKA